MTTPIVSVDFDLVQGDGWSTSFLCWTAVPFAPVNITGWAATFSLRQNYGDQTPLIACSIGSPTTNGSTVTLVTISPATSPNAVLVSLVSADTMLLVPNVTPAGVGLFRYNLYVTQPTQQPITIAAGAFRVRVRV